MSCNIGCYLDLRQRTVWVQNVSVEEKIPWRDYVPLMPLRYAEAPQGQCEEPYEAFEIRNTHMEKHRHTHPFFIPVFFEVQTNPCSSTVYAFNKACCVNAISNALKHKIT